MMAARLFGACLLGAFLGVGIGIAQEMLSAPPPVLAARHKPSGPTAVRAGAAAEVVIRVRPPPSAGPGVGGQFAAADRDREGYVTIGDTHALSHAKVTAAHADPQTAAR